MTPGSFFLWCVAVGCGGAFVVALAGTALSFASYMVGSELKWWRK